MTKQTKPRDEIREGDRIWLPELDNGEELIPRQRATVVGLEPCSWGTSLMVEIPDEDRDPDDRDGLRETGLDELDEEVELW